MPKDDKRSKTAHDMCLGDENKEVSMQEFDMVRANIFNLHSVRLVIIAKLKKAVKN